MAEQNKCFNGYIAFLDILGFKSRIESHEYREKYNDLTKMIGDRFEEDPKASIYMISDSIIITSKHFDSVQHYSRGLYTRGMLIDFWVRGAITQGKILKVDIKSITKENKNIILPYLEEAFKRAYDLESTLNMAGIIVDEKVISDNRELPLLENEDYIWYREYLPKVGNENKKRLLLPEINSESQIADTMYFKEMLRSHSEDIDKYINTFCFQIAALMKMSCQQNINIFLGTLMERLSADRQLTLIPKKVALIFLAVVEGLLDRYCSTNIDDYYDLSQLKADIIKILEVLKVHNYLSAFIDCLIEFDSKRKTGFYEIINEILDYKGEL